MYTTLAKTFVSITGAFCIVSSCKPNTSSDPKRIIGQNNLTVVNLKSSGTPKFLKEHGYTAIGQLDEGNCTVTHIGNNFAVTAGHCLLNAEAANAIKNKPCSNSVKWGVLKDASPVKSSRCETVVYAILNDDADVALLKLSEAPQAFFKLDTRGLKQSLSLIVVGHPAGDPLSFAKGCFMRPASGMSPSKPFFNHTCDTLGGSSGSPIFASDTEKIIGIHVSGKQSYNIGVVSKFISEKLSPLGVVLP